MKPLLHGSWGSFYVDCDGDFLAKGREWPGRVIFWQPLIKRTEAVYLLTGLLEEILLFFMTKLCNPNYAFEISAVEWMNVMYHDL